MKSAKIIVAYPQPKDAKAFDAVYQNEHVPLAVAKLEGKTKIVATKVLQSPQGKPAFYCIVEVHFPSMEALQSAPGPSAARRRWRAQRESPPEGLPW